MNLGDLYNDLGKYDEALKATKEALKDPKYAKINLVDTVYGNDKLEDSYKAAQGLVDKYPNLKPANEQTAKNSHFCPHDLHALVLRG